MNIWERCLELLYPNTCCFCGKISKSSRCFACEKEIEYVKEPVCKICGKPILSTEKERCSDCEGKEHFFEQGKSVWLHKGLVRRSIYQFKYHNRRIYGKYYAEEMCRLYSEKVEEWGIDVIIPVPLHPKRKRKRGYNQAEVIARYLGKNLQLPVDTTCVIRKKNTKPQKLLANKERKKNMRGVFEVKSIRKEWKNILVVDDIYTTGSTINEMAKCLTEKDARKVFFLTISIGQGF